MKMFTGIITILTIAYTVKCEISYEDFIKKIGKSPLMRASFEKNTKVFGGRRSAEAFPCKPIAPSNPVPTSVHKLRPGDIKVVAALGDSLTAGIGITAKNIFDLLTEERGKSFSIGGDGTFDDYVTIPNILKNYNPNITGFSIKTGGLYSKNARFNVAEAGNVFQDLSDEARLLITRMKADINIDINNDWKLITILIGDNDLCKFCNEDGHEAERYKALLEKTIQILQDSLPRTIINILEVLNVEITKDLNKGLFCSAIHFTLCGCASYPKDKQDEIDLRNVTRVYQNIVNDIATSGKFEKEDFTVVDQPLFRNTYLPTVEGEPDLSYFAPDCFHLSHKGQATAAVALWNNMFQPVGKKDTTWGIGNSVFCPTEESPYIYTNKNSVNRTSNKSVYIRDHTLKFKQDTQSRNRHEKYEKLVQHVSKNPLLMKSFEENLKEFGGKPEKTDFPCKVLAPSPSVPTSVHKLRPGDIKVVGALGDSITAGNGITAKTIFGVLRQDRGLSYSIGGDDTFEEAITLPNILKKYNPGITGYSIKSGKVSSKYSAFNVAEPGNVFNDLTDEANTLIKRMKADINIDINNDWKLITILIGDNDLCDICDEDGHEAKRYVAMLEKTLDTLRTNLPRTIVNVVEVLNVDIVRKLNKGLICTVVHFFLCKCAAFPKTDDDKGELRNMTRRYQTIVHELATSGKYDTTEDFTVVDQPFFRDTYVPRKPGTNDVDLSYFAPDCFHLSERGHSNAAIALWNNMLEPVGKKATEWVLGETVNCPSEESPYIFTNKNSPKY